MKIKHSKQRTPICEALLFVWERIWYSYLRSLFFPLGVYMFGFLLMTPQLFINYRLKSVAHLPWRVLTYKVCVCLFVCLFVQMIVETETLLSTTNLDQLAYRKFQLKRGEPGE